MSAVTVRQLCDGDVSAVERIFDVTAFGGMTRDLWGRERYREICIGWYLGPGRSDAAVAVHADRGTIGYALVCANGRAATASARTAASGLARRATVAALTGRLDRYSRDFYLRRLRDLFALGGVGRHPPAGVHAHLNALPGAGRTEAVIRLVAHVDQVCREVANDAWFGEVNERHGRRARSLERLGFEVVGRARNHTFTAITGAPVDRLVVVRRLPVEPDSDPLQRLRSGYQ